MKRPSHKKKNIVLLVLLAVLCIGGVELAACRYFEPAYYQQITAPVRQGITALVGLCRTGYDSVSAFCRYVLAHTSSVSVELTNHAEEAKKLAELQLASDPSLQDHAPVDPLVTELTVQNGQEILTGGTINIVYFNQGDEAWVNQPYGSDNIGSYGCGPTAMAMAIASLTGQVTDPAAMAQWAADNGYWAKGCGSYLSIVAGTATAYGLQVESISGRTPDDLIEELLDGKILVALMGPGHFTQGGHFILLRGVTLSGDILVADPNSVERSLAVWDPQLLLDELSFKTENGAPLWALSLEKYSPEEDDSPPS